VDEFTRRERALLQALQEADSPSAHDAARVRERVLVAVGVVTVASAAATVGAVSTAVSAGSATSGPVVGASAASGFGIWKVALLGGGLAAASAVGVMLTGTTTDVPVRSHPTVDAADSSRAMASPPHPTQTGQVIPPEAAPPTTPSLRHQPTRQQETAETKPRTGRAGTLNLKEEALLLSEAQAALQRGDHQAAIVALAAHKRKFPQGILSGEREAALSVAYCKSGDLESGQARAKRFIEQSPRSPMVQRLRAACKLLPE
jgi:hypothetical protein